MELISRDWQPLQRYYRFLCMGKICHSLFNFQSLHSPSFIKYNSSLKMWILMMRLLLLLLIWPWKSTIVLLHPKSMLDFLRQLYSEQGRHLLKLFRIWFLLKEKLKDGRSLESTFLISVLTLSWIIHLITNLGISSFASLKRKKKLSNKRGRISKKRRKMQP